VYKLSPSEFREQVSAIPRVSSGDFLITFDDGHLSQLRHALPVLRDLKINGLFFITTGWVGSRPEIMQWPHIKELHSLGNCIGTHGHTHAFLTGLSSIALRTELQKSKEMTEDKLGSPVDYISMPGGRINRNVFDACCEAGYRFVYTSCPVHAEKELNIPDGGGGNTRVIGRLMVRRGMSPTLLRNFVSGNRNTLLRMNFEHMLKRRVKNVMGDSLYQALWSKILREKNASAENVQVL
jgi:peptidoglycan/xylan/chitin deacetylase (PgdA/CDA1 family)